MEILLVGDVEGVNVVLGEERGGVFVSVVVVDIEDGDRESVEFHFAEGRGEVFVHVGDDGEEGGVSGESAKFFEDELGRVESASGDDASEIFDDHLCLYGAFERGDLQRTQAVGVGFADDGVVDQRFVEGLL